MTEAKIFPRRGLVEGFFGPLWSMAHRQRLFEFGAARGMNTYLYAPKDDPYHRKHWRRPYPLKEWRQLRNLIRHAQKYQIDFVYGFHPGEGLCFSESEPIEILLKKARRFYDEGVRIFAVLFDDIPSRLTFQRDRGRFKNSLAGAEGDWLGRIVTAQPSSWRDVEWWICPSYYSEDRLLERVFGKFEPEFLETLAQHLPKDVACFWTGPSVVSKTISLNHMQRIARRVQRRLLLWDNYPVNDLSMRDELHIGPLIGRDSQLPRVVHAYLNNPLLQEALSFLPLSTCFDYARRPTRYKPEASWTGAVRKIFGAHALIHWRAIRRFAEKAHHAKKSKQPVTLNAHDRKQLVMTLEYIDQARVEKWAREIAPWRRIIHRSLNS